jgi:acetoacetyl-CoA synthetase
LEVGSPPKLWSPDPELVENANVTAYLQWLSEKYNLALKNYTELWQWSVDDSGAFWKSILAYFQVAYDGNVDRVTNGMAMPDTRWFEQLNLSYAEHVFRNENSERPAVIATDEKGQTKTVAWSSLRGQVASLQEHLRERGITMGDRIVAYLPNTIEATIGFLAANGLGCIWSSCSPDFGVPAVVERFGQINPRVLIATTGYSYGGKYFDTMASLREIVRSLPSLEEVVLVTADKQPAEALPGHTVNTRHWTDVVARTQSKLECRRVPFNHPIWILYSSGTTGKPKAIVHTTGGILLEHFKYGSFHNDFRKGERCFWFTTTGWMMWNYIHGSLLAGCTLVLFDGNPVYPTPMTLWKLADEQGIAHFGVSAAYILSCMRSHLAPAGTLSLTALRSIGSTGSTLPPEGFQWIYEQVKLTVWLCSMSGGTDVCSAFVGGNPTLPVYAGEIQCRALGCSLFAFNENGQPVTDTVGEMVITKPMPSMPLCFWNDEGNTRYRESYFETFPGVWRHGDWIRVTPNGGVIIYGRSDATLNRGGVRIGTSEVYSAVDLVTEVRDSLIVCIESKDGQFWMPLFVVMQSGTPLTTEIKSRINHSLRSNFSPRHVPDQIIEVPDIPYTISGKKTETPVKKILLGTPPSKALNRDVLRNPGAMDFFVALAAERRGSSGSA